MSGAADSFFRLRPSGLCAPDRPLLKRRLTGRGEICVIYASGSGCAALPAPFSCRVICRTGWRLHPAARHNECRLRTARQPCMYKLSLNGQQICIVNYPLRRFSSVIRPAQLQSWARFIHGWPRYNRLRSIHI